MLKSVKVNSAKFEFIHDSQKIVKFKPVKSFISITTKGTRLRTVKFSLELRGKNMSNAYKQSRIEIFIILKMKLLN